MSKHALMVEYLRLTSLYIEESRAVECAGCSHISSDRICQYCGGFLDEDRQAHAFLDAVSITEYFKVKNRLTEQALKHYGTSETFAE